MEIRVPTEETGGGAYCKLRRAGHNEGTHGCETDKDIYDTTINAD